MLRSVAAVVVGFLVCTGVVIAGVMVASAALAGPDADPGPAYLTANLLVSFAAAVLGGAIAAHVARRHPVLHGAVLGAVFVAMSLPGLASPALGQPAWYPATIALLAAAGAIAGSALIRWKGSRRSPMVPGSPA